MEASMTEVSLRRISYWRHEVNVMYYANEGRTNRFVVVVEQEGEEVD